MLLRFAAAGKPRMAHPDHGPRCTPQPCIEAGACLSAGPVVRRCLTRVAITCISLDRRRGLPRRRRGVFKVQPGPQIRLRILRGKCSQH